jgi:hypothetical protein
MNLMKKNAGSSIVLLWEKASKAKSAGSSILD